MQWGRWSKHVYALACNILSTACLFRHWYHLKYCLVFPRMFTQNGSNVFLPFVPVLIWWVPLAFPHHPAGLLTECDGIVEVFISSVLFFNLHISGSFSQNFCGAACTLNPSKLQCTSLTRYIIPPALAGWYSEQPLSHSVCIPAFVDDFSSLGVFCCSWSMSCV